MEEPTSANKDEAAPIVLRRVRRKQTKLTFKHSTQQSQLYHQEKTPLDKKPQMTDFKERESIGPLSSVQQEKKK